MSKSDTSSTFFFPLRTNTKFFETRDTYLGLRTRVKFALLIYDRIVFQDGVYMCSIGPTGSVDGIRPVLDSDHDVELATDSKGERFHLSFKPSSAGPDTPSTTLLDSPLEHSFRSNFRPILSEIQSAGIADAEYLGITMETHSKSAASRYTSEAIRKLGIDQPDRFLYQRLFNNLYLDLILLADLQWPAAIDSEYSSYLPEIASGRFIPSAAPGFLSFELTFPNVHHLDWSEIADLRSEPSLFELRKKLFEVEASARAMLGEATTEEIGQQIHRTMLYELVDEIFKSHHGVARRIGAYAGSLSLNVLGGILPPISLIEVGLEAASAMRAVAEQERFSSSWIAGFMELKSRAAE